MELRSQKVKELVVKQQGLENELSEKQSLLEIEQNKTRRLEEQKREAEEKLEKTRVENEKLMVAKDNEIERLRREVEEIKRVHQLQSYASEVVVPNANPADPEVTANRVAERNKGNIFDNI